MPSVGLVFLADLHAFGSWISDLSPAWARGRGLDGPLLPPTVRPPPVVVVVVATASWNLLEISVGWLRLASRVVLVIDRTDDEPRLRDPDRAGMEQLERAQLAADLPCPVEFVDVDSAGREAAIDRALALARAPGPAHWSALERLTVAPAVSPGSWHRWVPPTFDELGVDDAWALRRLAGGLCDGPALLDTRAGERLDLCTGVRTPVAGLRRERAWETIAAAPDGDRWMQAQEGHRGCAVVDQAGAAAACPGGWGTPIGIEPGGRVGWSGGRCYFHWRVLGERGPAYWTPSSHDWPCGHGKKLYGYKDNDPSWVQLAADASACVSVYEHDALISAGLPLRWRDVGGFAIAERMYGEPRALLFEYDGEYPGELGDEDTRDRAPAVTVGPSESIRYVVGLAAPTYRLARGEVEFIGGPAGGWAAFDALHRPVARGQGRLLAGWDRWIVLEDAGQLCRRDLIDGTTLSLGPSDRAVALAVALPGTPNVVLFSWDEGGMVRVV